MRLENLIRLIQGTLLTKPAISAISGIAFDPTKVKAGDLFICLDRLQSSLEIAAKAGAHAVVFDNHVDITDSEIAWIEVDNLEMALIRLTRFYIANYNINSYVLTNLEFSLTKSMSHPKTFLLVEYTLVDLLRNLWDGNLPLAIASNNPLLMERIAPEATTLTKPQEKPRILSSSTLFQSSFVFDGFFYQHIFLPPFWIETFCSLAQLFKKYDWQYSSFKPLMHFVPFFVDKHLFVHPFGTTRRAFIIESDPTLFEEEVKQLKSLYKKSDICICTPKNESLHVKSDFVYENEGDLLDLNPKEFRYACILGDMMKIERVLQAQEKFKQATLF